MIWHIFRKDLRLLWPLALTLVLFQALSVIASVAQGHFSDRADLRVFSDFMPVIAWLAHIVLIGVLVQQEAIPGVTQDWLVRPIRRRDLLLAKFLFVVVVVHGPIFIADVVECVASGFDAGTGFKSALTDGISKFLLLSLPALMFASVTRNLVELFGGGLAIFLLVAALLIAGNLMVRQPPPVSTSGLAWIRPQLIAVVFIGMALVLLPLQYRRRATNKSRALVVIGALTFAGVWTILPWKSSFAFQEFMTAGSGARSSVVIGYEPAVGALRRSTELLPTGLEGTITVFVPLKVSGVPAGSFLLLDRAEYRLTNQQGLTIYRGTMRRFSESVLRIVATEASSQSAPMSSGSFQTHQGIAIPALLYKALKDRPVQLEVDYSLSIMQPLREFSLAALGGSARDERLGWCVTRADREGDRVELSCLTPNKPPSCAVISLAHEASGSRNTPTDGCSPDYAPFPFEITPARMRHIALKLRFADAKGETVYPVGAAKLPESRVVVSTFEAADHFTRHVVVPAIRLGDWLPIARDGSAQVSAR